MIRIDNRVGSRHLLTPITNAGIPCKLQRMEFGDIAFLINGPGGTHLSVGIELKTLADFLGSVTSSRLIDHQVPGMHRTYNIRIIIIQGTFKPSRTGGIDGQVESFSQRRRRPRWVPNPTRYTYAQLIRLTYTLDLILGFKILRSNTELETAAMIENLYRWGQKKWSQHKGFKTVNKQNYIGSVRMRAPTPERRAAAIIPGIGADRSSAVAQRFNSPLEMYQASVADWLEVDGVGPKTAKKAWLWCRGKIR